MTGAFAFKQHTGQTDIKWKKTIFACLYEQLFNLNMLRDSFCMHSPVHGAWARTDLLDGICLVLKEPRDKKKQTKKTITTKTISDGLHVKDNWSISKFKAPW